MVDREPIEWPEGWKPQQGFAVARYFGDRVSAILLSKGDLEHILATGPDMLERWDELVGDQ